MTPIQQAIETARLERGKDFPDFRTLIYQLEKFLPTEKQFARDCFQAGEDYVGELEQGNPRDAINFETYYKKIEK